MLYSQDDFERILAARMGKGEEYRKAVSADRHCVYYLDAPVRERIGLAGEIAFAELYDLRVDESIHWSGDNGIDFTIPAGTVDVKSSDTAGMLVLNPNPSHPPTILVLAKYSHQTGRARCTGWCFWTWFQMSYEIRSFGHGPRWTVNSRLLQPMPETLDGFIV